MHRCIETTVTEAPPAAPSRKVLIVSPHWPPVNAPDLQRVRMSLSYYRQCGWEPVVLCVDARDVAGTRESELELTYPPDIRIVRVRAFSLHWTRRFGLSNLGWRAWWSLQRTGSRLLRRERFDLVFGEIEDRAAERLRTRHGSRTSLPVVARLSRSRCACATSAS